MSPITRYGPRCHRCPERRPMWDTKSGLCQSCHSLLTAFGHTPGPPPITRFDALVALGGARLSDAPEFDEDLQSWLGGSGT